eukprot:4991667-Amphidinium_carterae.1
MPIVLQTGPCNASQGRAKEGGGMGQASCRDIGVSQSNNPVGLSHTERLNSLPFQNRTLTSPKEIEPTNLRKTSSASGARR